MLSTGITSVQFVQEPLAVPVLSQSKACALLNAKQCSADTRLPPTPPRSPEHDPFLNSPSAASDPFTEPPSPESREDILRELFGLPDTDIDDFIAEMETSLNGGLLHPTSDRDTFAEFFLNKDPMLSDPALESAGLSGRFPKETSIEDSISRHDQKFFMDIASQCVDPAEVCVNPVFVFPHGLSPPTSPKEEATKLSPAGSKRRATPVETPPTSESGKSCLD